MSDFAAQATFDDFRAAVCRGGKTEVLKILRKHPEYLNRPDVDNVTALMDAACNNHISILSLLLELGATVDNVNVIGRTALMEAACRGHPAVTLRLCQARPNLDIKNHNHSLQPTSLHEAASRGHAGSVFWLCEARASLELTTTWGDTALHLAASSNRYDTVRVLVAHGANLHTTTRKGLTALQLSLIKGYTRIYAFLSEAQQYTPLQLRQLYTTLKTQYKDQLQHEVNYDAAIISRQLPVLQSLPILPPLRHTAIPIGIPLGRSTEYPPPLTTEQLNQLLLQPVYPRTRPLEILPPFGLCQWVSVNRNSRVSSIRDRITTYEESIGINKEFPILTLYDNGTWNYLRDSHSGDLHGTFQIDLLITHNTTHYSNIPLTPYDKQTFNIYDDNNDNSNDKSDNNNNNNDSMNDSDIPSNNNDSMLDNNNNTDNTDISKNTTTTTTSSSNKKTPLLLPNALNNDELHQQYLLRSQYFAQSQPPVPPIYNDEWVSPTTQASKLVSASSTNSTGDNAPSPTTNNTNNMPSPPNNNSDTTMGITPSSNNNNNNKNNNKEFTHDNILWDWYNYQFIYRITLITERNKQTDEVVSFLLNSSICLGHLCMSMHPLSRPWWIFDLPHGNST